MRPILEVFRMGILIKCSEPDDFTRKVIGKTEWLHCLCDFRPRSAIIDTPRCRSITITAQQISEEMYHTAIIVDY